ncbi:uncharacterized protein LOC123537227 [Mercenaria mercenaria]|uniref:uncharacterized protein LOC123537227 n=1 Tax=Mercenaria mercenaria TaxID=6596 RepID=UPI00234F5546|nr:uncharacterized protein LOC123537227 [Mercenaria mercenaria]
MAKSILVIQILCLLLFNADKFATADAHETTSLFVKRDEYKNDLTRIIRRVEDLESSNDVIKSENRKLQDEVTSLKTFISSLDAENRRTVSDLQSQISDLQVANKQNEQIIQSIVSTLQSDIKENTSNFPSQTYALQSENKDTLVDIASQTNWTQSAPQYEQLHESQRKGYPVTNISASGFKTGQTQKRLTGHKGYRITRAENEANIAFYATVGNHHIEHAGVNQNIIFDHVITNLGNAYNKYAGDFKAPVSGTYVFSVTLMAYNTQSTHYRIAKNGTVMGNLYLHGKDGSDATSAMTAVLQLQQGDDVSIQNLDADKNLHGYAYSTFSGFLLQQDYSSTAIVGK